MVDTLQNVWGEAIVSVKVIFDIVYEEKIFILANVRAPSLPLTL